MSIFKRNKQNIFALALSLLILSGSLTSCSYFGGENPDVSETIPTEITTTVTETSETEVTVTETVPTETILSAEELSGMFISDIASILFNRDVSPDEFTAEAQSLASGATDAYTVVENLVFGDEFSSLNLSNEEIINRLNAALVCESLGTDVVNLLVSELDAGVSLEYIVDALTDQIAFEDNCLTYGVSSNYGNIATRSDVYDFLSSLPELEEQVVLGIGGYIPSDESMAGLNAVMDELGTHYYHYGFLLIDINTGYGIAYNYDSEFYLASSIKGPYALSFARFNEEGARMYSNTIINMLVNSDNDAYTTLNDRYHRTYIFDWCTECGLDPAICTYKYPRFGCRNMATLWLHGYEYLNGEIVLEDGSIAGYMVDAEDDEPFAPTIGGWLDHPEYSLINSVLGDMYMTQSKAGWMIGEDSARYNSTVDAGIVYAGDNPYIVVIESTIPKNIVPLIPLMQQLDLMHDEIVNSFWY